MTETHGDFLLAIARRMVPDAANLDAEGKRRFFELIDGALTSRSLTVLRQLGLFLHVMRWLPLLRYGGRLDHLGPAQQDSALRWFQNGPIALFRKGFWGIKVLVFMGYYARTEISESLGYRPSQQGNTLLHA